MVRRALGSFAAIALDLLRNVDRLAVVPIAVDGEEQLWLDLPETVEHAALAEVRRAGGEDRAERGGGEHDRDRFRHVRQHRGDAVAQRQRPPPASPAAGSRRAPESSSKESRRSTLSSPRKTIAVSSPSLAQQVLRKIQPRVGEKARLPHRAAIETMRRAPFSPMTLAEIPDERPRTLPDRRPTRRAANRSRRRSLPARRPASAAKTEIGRAGQRSRIGTPERSVVHRLVSRRFG